MVGTEFGLDGCAYSWKTGDVVVIFPFPSALASFNFRTMNNIQISVSLILIKTMSNFNTLLRENPCFVTSVLRSTILFHNCVKYTEFLNCN